MIERQNFYEMLNKELQSSLSYAIIQLFLKFQKWSEHFISYWSFVIRSACSLNIICFLATTIAVIFNDTELYFMASWDSDLLWEWQIPVPSPLLWNNSPPEDFKPSPSPCSVPPRLSLFNLFTPTPGPLGHNSSVIVFFWENKPGSWLPQNCLLLVFWLVRWGQLWPLIGHMPHWAPGHWAPTVPHPAIPCLMSAATINFLFIPPTKGHVSTPMIFNVPNILGHCRVFRWDKQPPGLALNWVHFLGVKLEQ